jgi:hypothetical protein
MSEGKPVTMRELFERRAQQLRDEKAAQEAWEQTPEGQEWRRAQDEHHRRMREADARWAAEHPEPDEDEADEDNDEPTEEDEV